MSWEAWGDDDDGHEGCLTQMQVDEAVEEATAGLRGALHRIAEMAEAGGCTLHDIHEIAAKALGSAQTASEVK